MATDFAPPHHLIGGPKAEESIEKLKNLFPGFQCQEKDLIVSRVNLGLIFSERKNGKPSDDYGKAEYRNCDRSAPFKAYIRQRRLGLFIVRVSETAASFQARAPHITEERNTHPTLIFDVTIWMNKLVHHSDTYIAEPKLNEPTDIVKTSERTDLTDNTEIYQTADELDANKMAQKEVYYEIAAGPIKKHHRNAVGEHHERYAHAKENEVMILGGKVHVKRNITIQSLVKGRGSQNFFNSYFNSNEVDLRMPSAFKPGVMDLAMTVMADFVYQAVGGRPDFSPKAASSKDPA